MKNLTNNLALLYSSVDIQNRVSAMGKSISEKFEAKDPIFIGVLNGSFMFMADLLRAVTIECEIDFI